ncbi:MAG: type II toxin-antitoxin system VapB family antitoxin, partial [Acidobacteria bacterium]|nr:type II toxin-antitoxin system VapB family antitoxin [Acidobacteriota bacterium]
LVEKELKKAIEKLDVMYLNAKEREFYEAEQKAFRDRAEALRTAEAKGKKEGIEEAIKEMVKRLKRENIDIAFISKVSGHSTEEIEHI